MAGEMKLETLGPRAGDESRRGTCGVSREYRGVAWACGVCKFGRVIEKHLICGEDRVRAPHGDRVRAPHTLCSDSGLLESGNGTLEGQASSREDSRPAPAILASSERDPSWPGKAEERARRRERANRADPPRATRVRADGQGVRPPPRAAEGRSRQGDAMPYALPYRAFEDRRRSERTPARGADRTLPPLTSASASRTRLLVDNAVENRPNRHRRREASFGRPVKQSARRVCAVRTSGGAYPLVQGAVRLKGPPGATRPSRFFLDRAGASTPALALRAFRSV
jgi:hypothetical protein